MHDIRERSKNILWGMTVAKKKATEFRLTHAYVCLHSQRHYDLYNDDDGEVGTSLLIQKNMLCVSISKFAVPTQYVLSILMLKLGLYVIQWQRVN